MFLESVLLVAQTEETERFKFPRSFAVSVSVKHKLQHPCHSRTVRMEQFKTHQ